MEKEGFKINKFKEAESYNYLLKDVLHRPQYYRDLMLTDNLVKSVMLFKNKHLEVNAAQYAAHKHIAVHNASVHLNILYNKGFISRMKKQTKAGFVYFYRARESLM